MITSMTAFANRTGAADGVSWTWEMRGVNARGLDLRLRVPDGIDGLEASLRATLGKALNRGNINLVLRVTREDGTRGQAIDQAQLDAVLAALDQVQERAFEMGVTLAQPNAADVLGQRGVMVTIQQEDDTPDLAALLMADFAPLLADFTAMRAAEGAALERVITAQVNEIEALVTKAEAAAEARRPEVVDTLRRSMQKILDGVTDVDEGRIAQELALLAVKSDVTEEIDRLRAHIAAARDLLSSDKPNGRKLDFLTQEFNREANTLCSKAGAAALTAVGLDLKAVVDQMREQIQNVE